MNYANINDTELTKLFNEQMDTKLSVDWDIELNREYYERQLERDGLGGD